MYSTNFLTTFFLYSDSSVCSVGETSTLADEVNEVMGKMDPNDLQDIASDDEEDNQPNDIQTTDGMYIFDLVTLCGLIKTWWNSIKLN